MFRNHAVLCVRGNPRQEGEPAEFPLGDTNGNDTHPDEETVLETTPEKEIGHKPNVLERVIEVFNVMICDEGTNDYVHRQLVLTDRLMYIFCLPITKCTCCPDEFFCPDFPTLEFKIEYKSI